MGWLDLENPLCQNPSTRLGLTGRGLAGRGLVRVRELLPGPLPSRPLPVTPTGFETHDSHQQNTFFLGKYFFHFSTFGDTFRPCNACDWEVPSSQNPYKYSTSNLGMLKYNLGILWARKVAQVRKTKTSNIKYYKYLVQVTYILLTTIVK